MWRTTTACNGQCGKSIDDTLIVENLGYLQFKSMPGIYRLEIHEAHSREVFQLESAGNEGWQSPTIENAGSGITVVSFDGIIKYLIMNVYS